MWNWPESFSRPLDQQLPVLPLAAALPRQIVHAGEIGSFERVGGQNWPRHEKSHQAHRLGIRCSNGSEDDQRKSVRFEHRRPTARRRMRTARRAMLGGPAGSLPVRTRGSIVTLGHGLFLVRSDAAVHRHRRSAMWFIVRWNAIGDQQFWPRTGGLRPAFAAGFCSARSADRCPCASAGRVLAASGIRGVY